MAGLFITLEGIDGCGKTTQQKRLVSALEFLNVPHIGTREPGGSEAGNKIRAILIDSAQLALEPKAELFLFLANRVQNLAEIVKPAVAEGKIVVSDRHRDSSIAFQGGGRELGVEWVEQLHEEALDTVPDCTVLIDISVATSRERAKARDAHIPAEQLDRFEREATEFHDRIHTAYRQLAKSHADRFLTINGEQSIDNVTRELFAALASRYPGQLGKLADEATLHRVTA